MKRLIEIQQALKVSKDSFNKFGGFPYRSASQILEKVKPLLAEKKLSVLLSDNLECYANRVFLRATAGVYDESGTCIAASTSSAELDQHKGMSKEQQTGSASSYARKYALCGLFAIDDSSADPDSMQPIQVTTQQQESTQQQVSIPQELQKIADADRQKITEDILSAETYESVKELLAINGIDIKSKDWADLRNKLNEKFAKK